MSETPVSAGIERVRQALLRAGATSQVLELPASTRSAAEAAHALGCHVSQIAKSIVFRGRSSGEAILVIASGASRVDEARVSALVGEPITKADASFVREHTGFAIGGVPPVGHVNSIRTLLDEDLWQYACLWAAAGTPHAVFRTTAEELLRATQGSRAAVAATTAPPPPRGV
ncbi:MAG: YbaK/EbsC family protein [Planctomycetes bacterium]|nr:YbaK/EbsC family protein [Planctomycetota bacterium]